MLKHLRFILLTNVVFVVLYMLFNWFEYAWLHFSMDSNTAIGSSFPFYIETTTYHPMTGSFIVVYFPNFNLMIFLIAIFFFGIAAAATKFGMIRDVINKKKSDLPTEHFLALADFLRDWRQEGREEKVLSVWFLQPSFYSPRTID